MHHFDHIAYYYALRRWHPRATQRDAFMHGYYFALVSFETDTNVANPETALTSR